MSPSPEIVQQKLDLNAEYEHIPQEVYLDFSTPESCEFGLTELSSIFLSEEYEQTGINIYIVKPSFPKGFKVGEYTPEDIQYFQSVAEEHGKTREKSARSFIQNKVERFVSNRFDPIQLRCFADTTRKEKTHLNHITFFVQINPEFFNRSQFDESLSNFISYNITKLEAIGIYPPNDNLLFLTLQIPNGVRNGNSQVINEKITKLLWEKIEEVLNEEE